MLDILYGIGAAIAGGVAGYFIGQALVKYWERAKNWFEHVWRGLKRVYRGVGLLVKEGGRLYKRFVALLFNDEIETYVETDDPGVEIDRDELSREALKALDEDGFIPVSCYE